MIGEKTLELLKQVLADSSYTVAICGSGMMEEGGILGLKQEGRAYEIEQKYSGITGGAVSHFLSVQKAGTFL